MMVLIESSQTVKLTIDQLDFIEAFEFVSDSPVFSDYGSANYSACLSITLALQPTFCNTTGRVKTVINSIVAQVQNLKKDRLKVTTNTIPLVMMGEFFQNIDRFMLEKINDMLRLFRLDIERWANNMISETFYTNTSKSENGENPTP